MATQTPSSQPALKRRTVQTIEETLTPYKIFRLIHEKEGNYSDKYRKQYTCRDRAMMAMCFLTGGRITEIVGGDKQRRVYVAGLYPDPCDKRNWIEEAYDKHKGLLRENLTIEGNEDYLVINNMIIVKRSQKIIRRHKKATRRPQLIYPIKTGLYRNSYYNQTVPFVWLILEYLVKYAPKKGKLFNFEDHWAHKIVLHYTGMFPNWFRAQADRFYGNYIYTDILRHSQFTGRVNPLSSAPYMAFDSLRDIKNKEALMPSKWIIPAVVEIQERMGL